MECPICDGGGDVDSESEHYCEHCEHGRFEIATCPLELITSDIWNAIEFAGLYKRGLPPIAGGSLAQTKSFNDAAGFIWNEQAHWKNKLSLM